MFDIKKGCCAYYCRVSTPDPEKYNVIIVARIIILGLLCVVQASYTVSEKQQHNFRLRHQFLGCTVTQLKNNLKNIQCIMSRNYHVIGDTQIRLFSKF